MKTSLQSIPITPSSDSVWTSNTPNHFKMIGQQFQNIKVTLINLPSIDSFEQKILIPCCGRY